VRLVLLTSSASFQQAVRLTGPHTQVVWEEAPVGGKAEETTGQCVADLVLPSWSAQDPETRTAIIALLQDLAEALGAQRWQCAGIPLWDLVSTDFYLYHLERVLQAIELAGQLLNVTRPSRVTVSALDSCLARALVTVSRRRGLPTETLARRPHGGVRAPGIRWLRHRRLVAGWLQAFRCRGERVKGRVAPIVLVNHTARNFVGLQPVLRALGQRLPPERLLVLQVGADGIPEVRASKAACARLEAYASLDGGLTAWKALQPILGGLASGGWRSALEATGIEWAGVSLTEAAGPEIARGLAHLLCVAAWNVVCAQRFLAREKPAKIILTNERAVFGRVLARSAQAARVPTLMLQFGLITAHPLWAAPIAADIAALDGDASVEALRAVGNVSGAELQVTGQPKHDLLLAEAATASKTEICRKHGLDPGRPIVLYACHAFGEQSGRFQRNAVERSQLEREIEAVYRAMGHLAGVQLAIKPHPNEDMAFHQALLERLGGPDCHLFPKDELIYPLLFACDVLVTHHSTVGVEAVVLGKPVVIVNLTGQPDVFPYVQSGVALPAYRDAEVEPALQRALFDEEARRTLEEGRPRFICQYALRGDPPPSDRIADLALRTAQRCP